MKSMGNLDHLSYFIHNPLWMFLGGIAHDIVVAIVISIHHRIIALVASGVVPSLAAVAAVFGVNAGTTGTIWLAGAFVSDGMPKGDTLRIAMAHTSMKSIRLCQCCYLFHLNQDFWSRFDVGNNYIMATGPLGRQPDKLDYLSPTQSLFCINHHWC